MVRRAVDLIDAERTAGRSLVLEVNLSARSIGAALELRTIAECVETVESLRLLQQYGVDFAQGYHIARPGPVEEIGASRPAQAVPE